MIKWLEIVEGIEALDGLTLNGDLVAALERRGSNLSSPQTGIRFYIPTFKSFQTLEIRGCGRNAWPAVSITGSDCKLQCDHCKAKILAPMIPARTPEELWRVVQGLVANGAQGMLLTGGSNHRNEVEYDPYYPVVRRIKDNWPSFKIAVHTALVDAGTVRSMAAGAALARFLIDYAGGHVSRMRFDASGHQTDFGMDRDALEALVNSGKPFQTSGCSGHDYDIYACNRPYGDPMPADIRSFPFALGARDVALVRRQMRRDDVETYEEP